MLRNTKILATLGPSSSTPEQILELARAGVNIFRLNMSHGSHDDHRARLAAIRAAEKALERPIGALFDLQGPKLRIGKFPQPTTVQTGARYEFVLDEVEGNAQRASLPHPEAFAALEPGHVILVNDGKMAFHVEQVEPRRIATRVTVGGEMSSNKGFNLPHTVLPMSAITDKDRKDAEFALQEGADWIAMSFVQTAQDVAELRQIVGKQAGIVAKIEKPSAVDDLEAIATLADGVMVARGDLGVELPPEDVPVVQRRIVHQCRHLGRPVIVATQMLESMITAPTPTRAEANDVATAVYEGADAVMLSAETAAGQFPLQAVQIMDRIIRRVENAPDYRKVMALDYSVADEPDRTDAIAACVRKVATLLPVTVSVAFTTSGASCLYLARERPSTPILGISPSLDTARRLTLVWGVVAYHGPDAENLEDMVVKTTFCATKLGLAQQGKPMVIIAGVPFGTPGSTNLLRIVYP
ncbi:pyruvate kinase [Chromobacterium sphagni]|uniref:Pyruvate kinase n=1 Tax=Chromobacterium sphagni TaxID=1903179 RepID=A0A1S1WY44_9NEIS|nr:pyruvate kinase [Chromobacterium sphagni]OHX12217.1 pyruvate kinase [Chromobacterium sphagni]OHX21698.1 pyruvate kinase [Chromobacterium sphagni]